MHRLKIKDLYDNKETQEEKLNKYKEKLLYDVCSKIELGNLSDGRTELLDSLGQDVFSWLSELLHNKKPFKRSAKNQTLSKDFIRLLYCYRKQSTVIKTAEVFSISERNVYTIVKLFDPECKSSLKQIEATIDKLNKNEEENRDVLMSLKKDVELTYINAKNEIENHLSWLNEKQHLTDEQVFELIPEYLHKCFMNSIEVLDENVRGIAKKDVEWIINAKASKRLFFYNVDDESVRQIKAMVKYLNIEMPALYN